MTWAWAVVIPALIVLTVSGWYWERHRVRRVIGRRLSLAELLADSRDPGTWPGVPPLHPVPPVVHQTPDHDAVPQVTPCCSVPVLLLPIGDDLNSDESKRTCGGRQP